MPEFLPGESPDQHETVAEGQASTSVSAQPYRLPQLEGDLANFPNAESSEIASDEVLLTIEFGSTRLSTAALGRLGTESLLTLQQNEEDTVPVVADGKVVAHGEVIVVNDHLAVEITRLVGGGTTQDSLEA